MTTSATVHIGVDISKKHLDLSPFDEGPGRLSNDSRGIRKLIQRIRVLESKVIVTFEATGGYEKVLLSSLLEEGIPAARVNSGQVRHFIRSQGQRAKNDQIDARMLSDFSRFRYERGRLFVSHKIDREREELKDLLNRRGQIMAMIQQEKNRLDPAPGKAMAADIRASIKQLERRLAATS